MTNDELSAIVSAARARQSDITPAPWVFHYAGQISNSDLSQAVIMADDFEELEINNPADADLLTEAPDLNAAVIALADELGAARARIEALEAHIAIFYP